jgi:hypothetical protein
MPAGLDSGVKEWFAMRKIFASYLYPAVPKKESQIFKPWRADPFSPLQTNCFHGLFDEANDFHGPFVITTRSN